MGSYTITCRPIKTQELQYTKYSIIEMSINNALKSKMKGVHIGSKAKDCLAWLLIIQITILK